MSSFFTLPASQRKRKRSEPSSKKVAPSRKSRAADEESISGSDISDEYVSAREAVEDGSEDEEEEYENEDPAAKRIRLAEQYLANTEKEVLQDVGFDAADVDQENLRRRMGERLKQDTAESKGKLYKWIADGLDWQGATSQILRPPGTSKSLTGVAIRGVHVYAVSKNQQLIKWEAPESIKDIKGQRPRKTWRIVGLSHSKRKDKNSQFHSGAILCVAASEDGKFVATGGNDKKLIIWEAASLKPLKVFHQHRDAVTALAFRKGTSQLFSASKDRTIKIWSLNELAYVETLFGHQDEVVGVSALAQEKCVSVGARDRTARLWKVVEESQLVFRGGGAPGTTKALESLRKAYEDDSGIDIRDNEAYHEGSMDQISMIDDDTFVTASDNGSLSLWNVNKKKAVYTLPLAHGTEPPVPVQEASAEQTPDEEADPKGRGGMQPRWITALVAVPFSDVIITGSWDGYVRAWKISQDKRRIEPLGAVGAFEQSALSALEPGDRMEISVDEGSVEVTKNDANEHRRLQGFVNDLSIIETGDRGKETVLLAAACGKQHRLGKWKNIDDGKNNVVLFQIPRKSTTSVDERSEPMDANITSDGDDEFVGFD
jgi:ribosomal RNA-processing protein 9